MSVLLIGTAGVLAETDEPGPFERMFHAMRRAFKEPQHKSTAHRSSRKQASENTNASASSADSNAQAGNSGGNVSKPPDEKNTRSTSRASSKRGEDLPYGTPVPGKQGFVTSPFSPNSGYVDVRGFAPGTPVKDPYTGKVFLTP
jgi:hypothetical protein